MKPKKKINLNVIISPELWSSFKETAEPSPRASLLGYSVFTDERANENVLFVSDDALKLWNESPNLFWDIVDRMEPTNA